jgi:hypothetical protein
MAPDREAAFDSSSPCGLLLSRFLDAFQSILVAFQSQESFFLGVRTPRSKHTGS